MKINYDYELVLDVLHEEMGFTIENNLLADIPIGDDVEWHILNCFRKCSKSEINSMLEVTLEKNIKTKRLTNVGLCHYMLLTRYIKDLAVANRRAHKYLLIREWDK